jgi:hypothetical protein
MSFDQRRIEIQKLLSNQSESRRRTGLIEVSAITLTEN